MKAIIIEDEPLSSMYLAALVQQWCAEVSLLEQVSSSYEALDAMQKHSPDLLFLDIQLGDESGLSLLESLQKNFPKIIITTALTHHTIGLIQNSGVPYLHKPVDKDDLTDAVQKISSISVEDFQIRAGMLYHSYIAGRFPDSVYADSINAPGQVLRLKNILVIESENDQTIFRTFNGQTIHAPNISFRLFQQSVDPVVFFRIDKKRFVNLNHIEQMIASASCLYLAGGLCFTLSFDRYEALTQVLNKKV